MKKVQAICTSPDGYVNINKLEFETKSFSIYPNPNNGVFKIKLNDSNNFNLKIYDELGRLVITNKYKSSLNEEHLISIANENPGLYFINLSNDIINYTGKIIYIK